MFPTPDYALAVAPVTGQVGDGAAFSIASLRTLRHRLRSFGTLVHYSFGEEVSDNP
jgi:hypothetical protein